MDNDEEPQHKKRKNAVEDDLFKEAVADPCFDDGQINMRHFDIMTFTQAKDYRSAIIDGCQQICDQPKGILEVCLRSSKIRWDTNSLCDFLYDEKKRDELFSELKLPDLQQDLQITVEEEKKTCEYCCNDAKLGKYNCGHILCVNCWGRYFELKILEGHHLIPCPGICSMVIDTNSTKQLVKDDNVLKKYEDNIVEDFVQTHPDLSWCRSGQGCNRIIKLKSTCFSPVRCHCGYEFCSLCGGEWHTPIQCSLLESFTAKLRNESETGNWIIVHTKQCPKCHTNIEKDGGCNHMTCRNRSCNYHFCWVCLGDWTKHRDNYNCNKFNENTKDISAARADLERFLHYCKRYDNHRVSMQFEKRTKQHVSNILDKYDMPDKSEGDRFRINMTKAVVILFKAKRCLQYTYAFAFHLKKDFNVEIFEMNQRDLEVSSETLSANLEHDLRADITLDALRTLNTNVLQRSVYCMKRREKLIEHVFEGIRKGLWQYHPSPTSTT